VAAIVQNTPYSIGYTELTYAVQNDLSYGSVQNSSGKLVKADFLTATAAAAGAIDAMTNDFRVSITDAPGPMLILYQVSPGCWFLQSLLMIRNEKRSSLFFGGDSPKVKNFCNLYTTRRFRLL
jgi:ABC-type phosphate transport system substrate-binding protein